MNVYLALSPNNKKYIGITKKDIKIREKEHRSAANCGSDFAFHSAIRKYGDDIVFSCLEKDLSIDEARSKEKYYIEHYDAIDNGYNMTKGGEAASYLNPGNLSQKLKKFYLSKENRNKNSTERGGYKFIALDIIEQKVVGKWISQGLCADELNLNHKSLQNLLRVGGGNCGKYIVCRPERLDLLKLKYRRFKVTDLQDNEIGVWFNKNQCHRDLKMSYSTIIKMLKNKTGKRCQYKAYYF